MAVIRSPPSPRQGGCGLNLVAAGHWPPGRHLPAEATARAGRAWPGHGAGRPRPARRLPAGALQGSALTLPAARGSPAPGGTRACRGALALCSQRRAPRRGPAFTGDGRIRAPNGLKQPLLPPWRRAPPCVPQWPTPRQRARRSARPRSCAARARASCRSDVRCNNGRAAHHAACSTPR
jgi:hypothetical protein